MKILHGPINIAGIPGVLARELRHLGHSADSYSFYDTYFKHFSDYVLNNPNSAKEKFINAVKFGVKYDVFHFHFGHSLLGPSLFDVNILNAFGKKIFFYFHGCDLRDEKHTIMNYDINACKNCFPKLCNPNRMKAIKVANQYGIVNFVSTPDLLEFVERPVLIPVPLDIDLIADINKIDNKKEHDHGLVIAHAPTSRTLKGSQHIIECVERLVSKGLNIKLLLIENVSHYEALSQYKNADIAIDQILIGSYGLCSVEMMALGIPTIVYMRDDVIKNYSEPPPLINANPKNLEEVIVYFYENRQLLDEYRVKGPQYAYSVHHPKNIAKKCLEWYIK